MDRWILTLTMLFLLGTGGALAGWPAASASRPLTIARSLPAKDVEGWRRTTRGWEHESEWTSRERPRAPALRIHPAVIAGLQVFSVLGVLVLFEKQK